MAVVGFYSDPSNASAKSWIEYQCRDYEARIGQWTFARDHYTGEAASPWKVPSYLVRKKVGETVEAYEERVLLADFTPYFGAVVDTLAGMMAQVEPDNDRDFGDLGEETDKDSVAGQLWIDADGDHNSWPTLWALLATDLTAIHDAWILVDGGPEGKTPHVRLIPAESVTNYRYVGGVCVEAVLKECVDTRTSVQDDPKNKYQDQWVVYTTSGWERFRKPDAPDATDPISLNKGPYSYKTRRGVPTIPLFRVQLPLRRNVGYLMARKANAIFNKESERDHLLRFASFPILNVFANDVTFTKITELLRQGARVLQVPPGGSPHSFAAPDTSAANMLGQTVKDKEAAYYATAFREFGSAAARLGRDRVTAAEVKSDTASGIAAFLGLLKSAIDNAENAALYLLEQTVFPSDESKWGLASVSRSGEFAPFDSDEVIQRMKDRYIGPSIAVPIGKSALIDVVEEIAEWDGIEVDEDEVAAAVDTLLKMQANGGAVPPPPSAPPPGRMVSVKRPGKPDTQIEVKEGGA